MENLIVISTVLKIIETIISIYQKTKSKEPPKNPTKKN